MKITLKQLTLENFKAIKKFTFKAKFKSLIRGANATGKTTIMDGFLWLLFDKDSQGKTDFSIKTLKNGQAVPKLEHSVEGIFDVDSRELTLKKVLKEKYTKKRGASRADLTGHTTDHYIDGVPIQKKEWDQRISAIIDEETFRLLTDPTYFNSDKFGQSIKPVKPAWERRREILFSLPDNIPTDDDIIASNKALTTLPEILGWKTPEKAANDSLTYTKNIVESGEMSNIASLAFARNKALEHSKRRSIDDHRKIVKATQTEINKRLTEIPSRIDELEKSLTDVSSYDVDAIRIEIKGIDDQIQAMADDAVRSNLRKQKAELQAKVSELETDKEMASREATKEINGKIDALKNELRIKQAYISDSLNEIAKKENTIKYHETVMAGLRRDYVEITKNKADVEDNCPACGQTLPKDQIHAAIKTHNGKQASRLADINSEGKRMKNEVAALTQEIEVITKEGLADRKGVKTLQDDLEGLKAAPVNQPTHTSAIEIGMLHDELQQIEKKLAENLPPDTGPLEEKRRTLQAKIADVDAAKRTRTRIEELEAERKKLATEYEELERQIFLMEQFTTLKAEMVEGPINEKFELARFKLFEKQINEGIRDTCITLYDGVPYGDALNSGAETKVGLDIVKTLSEYYRIKAPIFIDHAESVTEILDPGTQTIELIALELWICEDGHIFAGKVKGEIQKDECPECGSKSIEKYNKLDVINEKQ